MKNTFFKTIYLLLVCFVVLLADKANAQTWNFISNKVNDIDRTNLNADSQKWTYDATNDRWGNAKEITNAKLIANGAELEFTKELFITAPVADAVRIDAKKNCFTLNKANSAITIKNLSKGLRLTVTCKTTSKTSARGISVTNVTPVSGYFNSASLDEQTNIGVVTNDGDITLVNDGGIYIYSISVTDENPENPGEPGGSSDHSVKMDVKKNQMRLTFTNSDIKYYNTDEVKVAMNRAENTVTVTALSDGWSDVFTGSVSNISFAKAQETGGSGDIVNPEGVVEILEAKGWQESAYVKWKPFTGADTYKVYVKGGQYADWTKLDDQLVRDYGSYGRADAVGLMAGIYSFKVIPYNGTTEMPDNANEVANLDVINYSREGFAHKDMDEGVGAYNNDGTLKAGAHVIYITANTAKTVSLTLNSGTYTGLQNIIYGYQKNAGDKPLAVRIVGKISASDMDSFGSSAEGLQIKGKGAYSPLHITIEGIGDDATTSGFGFLVRNSKSVEFRNFSNMLCMDDCISIDSDNSNIWIHNMDFFYGSTGGDSDQAKGDGTVDMKGDSKYITVAYNRFWDSGKSSLCGMTSETGPNWITYHHNWFDHSDSRHPRIRTMSVHIWNNYYDGVAKYGVGAAKKSNAFVESNYFRGTKYPMLISKQGSDISGDGTGTFSGEDGGMIKSYGNIFAEKPSTFKYVTYQQNNTEFDAYEATTRDEFVPESVTAKQGGRGYDNFDTDNSLMYAYTPDAAADVPAVVTGYYGAGRLNHGDFSWDFTGKDADYSVDTALKSALNNYKSCLVKIFGDENASSEETGGEAGGETGEETGGGSTISASVECNFETGAPSNDAFTVTGGSYSTSRGTATVNGVTYTNALKIDSKVSVTFTTDKEMTITLVLSSLKANTIGIDGTQYTADSNFIVTATLPAGSHTIKKNGSESALFYIALSDVIE